MTPSDKADALRARKETGPAIAALTAYDYPTARLLDEAGTDLLLVGDSLGMVVLGFADTTAVTMAHMVHHTAAAARGNQKALLVADLPIHSYDTIPQALENARMLVAAGAEAVKLEGGRRQVEKVEALRAEGIEVLGHLGMLPQRVRGEGGYRPKGRTPDEIAWLEDGASALQEAGCFGVVLESVLPEIATRITSLLSIPTIGIGCGQGTCNGEIAVVTDVIGSYPWFVPPFATPRAEVAAQTTRAVAAYLQAVRSS